MSIGYTFLAEPTVLVESGSALEQLAAKFSELFSTERYDQKIELSFLRGFANARRN